MMSTPTAAIIVVKTYDLLKYAIPIINRLPRDYKFSLGDRLQNQLADLLEAVIEAGYLPTAEKRPVLMRVNIRLEKIRHFVRLGFELVPRPVNDVQVSEAHFLFH